MLLPFAETILCINCSKLSWKFSAFSIHTFVLIKKKTHIQKQTKKPPQAIHKQKGQSRKQNKEVKLTASFALQLQ